ncbi:MAG TPA: cysteine desulfurase family protein [Verrucomicrobiota bacterium]|nr:cysteine desulfurase family protein [Verrucomicrobiota bacterium]HNU50636.1 cysteine desulfurase family protein [Verrucomicrobiota bacterium]
MRRVYFDHLSATPVLPEAFEAMRPFFTEHFGNASSLHQEGLRVREALGAAREQVAGLIHAESPEEIFFTSCGAEAANLAVKGVAYANQRRGNHVVVSAIEHPAVLNSVEFLEKQGFTATRVAVDGDGRVDPGAVGLAVTEQTILIAVQHVNQDIGTIQRVGEIGAMARERGIPLFVDATVSGGWLPLDVQALGASLVSLSPHRFYGPKGVGVLYRNRRARLVSILHGGVQEGGRRAGTENVPAIVGAGVAAAAAAREWPARREHTGRLQRRLWEGLKARVPYVRLSGPEPGPERISTSLNVSTEFIEGEGQLLLCDRYGIAVASGSSCVSKSLKISHVLAAIGLDHALAQGNLILSLGKDNTEAEVDYFIETFAEKVVAKLRGMSPMWDAFERGALDSVIAPRGTGKSFAVHAAAVSGKGPGRKE